MTEEPGEIVDGELVLGGGRGVEALRRPGTVTPIGAQAVAVVGASMVAGAAALALVHRRRTRRAKRRSRRVLAPVVSRSFLVDVHMLGGDRK